MLAPSKLTSEQRDFLITLYQPLLARDVEDIADELERADRIAFDGAVLETFGIQTPLREIYDALLRLVEIRQSVLDDYSDE